MKKVLFVCTGNTCRSPMAEALLKHVGNGIFDVQSAGIFAGENQKMSFYAKRVLRDEGIECEHASQQVGKEIVHWSDSIVTMTEQHKQVLIHHFPHVEQKVCTLYEFCGEESYDISDPFGGTEEVYRQTYEELKRLIHKLV
jgi:protein arginine phosphatase